MINDNPTGKDKTATYVDKKESCYENDKTTELANYN